MRPGDLQIAESNGFLMKAHRTHAFHGPRVSSSLIDCFLRLLISDSGRR